MLRRITADLDFKNPFRVLFYVWRALKLKPKEIYLKPSNSKGYHLVVWIEMKTKYGNNSKVLRLRKYLGDDKQRRQIDKKRKTPRQYLFYKKVKI